MKARTLTFWIDNDRLPEVLDILDREVIPAYERSEHFVGVVVIRADKLERQVIGLSTWDDDVPGCEEVVDEFRGRLATISGTAPTTSTYDVLRLVMRRTLDGA